MRVFRDSQEERAGGLCCLRKVEAVQIVPSQLRWLT